MLGVLSAEGAILVALQTVAGVLLVLDRVVVSLLAFFASKGDFDPCVCSHSFGTSYFIYPVKPGIASLLFRRGRAGPCGIVHKNAHKNKTSRSTGNT
jgi:hypothetical protein